MQNKSPIKVISIYPTLLQSIQQYQDQDIEIIYDEYIYTTIIEAIKFGRPLPAELDLIKIYETNLALAKSLLDQGYQVRCMSVQDSYVPVALRINQVLGLPGPHLTAALYLKNKFFTRQIINEDFWFQEVDINKSNEQLAKQAESIKYPAFMKPTLDCRSRGIGKVENPQQFMDRVKSWQQQKNTDQLVQFFQYVLGVDCPYIPQYMVEQYIDLEKVDQLDLNCEIGPDSKDGFHTITFLAQKRYRIGKYSALTCESYLDWSAQELSEGASYVEQVLNKFVKIPNCNLQNYVLNVEAWRLTDGSYRITEINARASYCINMLVSTAYNSNFSVSCHRVIAGLQRRQDEQFFQKLLELKRANKNLQKSSLCAWIHYKGTGKVEDLFDFQSIDSYAGDIYNKQGKKKTYEYHQANGEYYDYKIYKPKDAIMTTDYENQAGHQLMFESMVRPETDGENSVIKAWNQHFEKIIKHAE